MTDEPLFLGYDPPPAPPSAGAALSAGRRLTLRQAEQISLGIHPLTRGALHPLADRHRTAESGRRDPFTCGSCWFRQQVGGAHDGRFPKCLYGYENPTDTVRARAPRVSNGPATDVRAWWPACPDYSAADTGLSPDAARMMAPR